MQNVAEIVKDPKFLALPEPERVKVLVAVDPNFAALPTTEQSRAAAMLTGGAGGKRPIGEAPTLTESRREATRSEFEYNQPRTAAGAVREGLLAIPDLLGVTAGSPGEVIKNIGLLPAKVVEGAYRAGTAPPESYIPAAKQAATTLKQGPTEMAAGVRERDPERFTRGLVETATVLGPPVRGSAALTKAVAGKAVAPIAKRASYAQDRPLLFTKPEGHLQNALKPDLDPEGLIRAGNELKAGELRIGKPVKDIDTARAALDAQFQKELMPQRRALIDPQKDVVIRGSRQAIVEAKIKAIPESVKLTDKPLYDSLVADIEASVPPTDFTLGQLEQLTTSLNQTNRVFHRANLSGALSKLETIKGSGDIAAENAARVQMYTGMDAQGLGGAGAVRNINQRVGAQIKLQDALDSVEQTARTEATRPRLPQAVQKMGRTVGSTVMKTVGASPGNQLTVNESIAAAMRKWKGEPARFSVTQPKTFQRPPASPLLAPAQGELAPSGGGMLLNPNTAQKWTPESSYQTQMQQRQLWEAGRPEPPPKGQLDLIPGGPSTLFPITEKLPSVKQIDSIADQLKKGGSIGTRGAHILAKMIEEMKKQGAFKK